MTSLIRDDIYYNICISLFEINCQTYSILPCSQSPFVVCTDFNITTKPMPLFYALSWPYSNPLTDSKRNISHFIVQQPLLHYAYSTNLLISNEQCNSRGGCGKVSNCYGIKTHIKPLGRSPLKLFYSNYWEPLDHLSWLVYFHTYRPSALLYS